MREIKELRVDVSALRTVIDDLPAIQAGRILEAIGMSWSDVLRTERYETEVPFSDRCRPGPAPSETRPG